MSNADFRKEKRNRERFVTKDEPIRVSFTKNVVFENINAIGDHRYHREKYRKFRLTNKGQPMDLNRYINECLAKNMREG